MSEKRIEGSKITVVGSGLVGSTSAYAIMMSGIASEIVLVDINRERAEGEAMDLNHGAAFAPPVVVRAGDYADCAGSDVIILCAGANQNPGETRLDLAKKNAAIFKDIIESINEYENEAILLVVTNPVDILTYLTAQISGRPTSRVLGSGTTLDTSRFRYLLGNHCNINPQNIHAYIIGEHGDSEVPAWSLTNISGVRFDEFCPTCGQQCDERDKEKIFVQVRDAAYHIIERKGATYYAIGLAVQRIVSSILRNENTILTVSSLIEGQYGLEDVALSLPTVVSGNGIEKVLDVPLSAEEEKRLRESAETLKETIEGLNLYEYSLV